MSSSEPGRETLPFKRKPKKIRLGKRAVEALPTPPEVGGKPVQAWTYDSETPRLAICVWSTGARTWYWVGRVNGRPARIKLGEFPEISLEQARKLAAADARQQSRARVASRPTRRRE